MTISNKEDLREFYGEPSERAQKKDTGYLVRHCRNFIAASSFCVLSSAGADGRGDASPKGGGPGFVAIACFAGRRRVCRPRPKPRSARDSILHEKGNP